MPQETVGYVELEWTCKNCGSKNPGANKVCAKCGAPMSESQNFALPAEQQLITDKDVLAKAEVGPDIHCPYCGTRNPSSNKACKQCGGDLTGGAVRAKGTVLGAFSTAKQPDVKCPFCGTMNTANAQQCKNCGGVLGATPAPPAAKAAAPAKAPAGLGIGALVIGALVIVACIALFAMGARTTDVIGVVRDVGWERTVSIMELRPVERRAWEDEIPREARVSACEPRVRYTQAEPAPNSERVCGTPYTIDQGSGIGKVVQDCQYNVYENYCAYSVTQWTPVDAVTVRGNDTNPRSPSVSLNAAQRAGEERQTLVVVFEADGKQYDYNPNSENEFRRYTRGSRWNLTINGFGQVTRAEPAP